MVKAEQIRIELFSNQKHLLLVDSITHLLHEAYAPLALKGMKYLASHQSADQTLERLESGESYLIFLMNELIGTVTLYPGKNTSTCDYYRQPGVFFFGQFAIKSGFQGQGIGSIVMDILEDRAAELGAKELALDTSEYAENLIGMYTKRGYSLVAHTQWEVTNYRSVILSKNLTDTVRN